MFDLSRMTQQHQLLILIIIIVIVVIVVFLVNKKEDVKEIKNIMKKELKNAKPRVRERVLVEANPRELERLKKKGTRRRGIINPWVQKRTSEERKRRRKKYLGFNSNKVAYTNGQFEGDMDIHALEYDHRERNSNGKKLSPNALVIRKNKIGPKEGDQVKDVQPTRF